MSSRSRTFVSRFTFLALAVLVACVDSDARAEFQAGAVTGDVTPVTLPVFVNGGMTSRQTDEINTRLNARAIALSDDETTIVICVVDSCMMPRPLLDEAKELASKRTGIPTDHMLISATHTHTAGSCMGALGTPPDPNYVPFLKERLAETITAAVATLQPAKIGYAKIDANEFAALRRWIRRPDRIAEDPFGNATVRANMHSGRNWDDVTGESGPKDPDLSLISIQSTDGTPIAVLANFSMHYFSGERGISADYFGLFSEGLKERIAPGTDFVGIMSHGCSGDIWRRDYTKPDTWERFANITQFSNELLDRAMEAYEEIEYRSDVDLAMAERRMTLKYRVPDKQRLEWAQRVIDAMETELPKTTEQVYAREQIILHERQETEIVMQGVRIGDIAIATTPNETYAITGLKIKAASPLEKTVVIELANGGDGYIPPPEQHLFGGYNTWAARSAGLEVTAEPKIAETCIALLEKVTGQPRRDTALTRGPAAQAIASLSPSAWYRLDEFAGPRAVDSSGNAADGFYEPEVTYYLEGPLSEKFCRDGQTNRAAMFAGGRLQSRLVGSGDRYSVSTWIWNGMPNDGRDVSGWIFSRGRDWGLGAESDHLGIGGTSGHTGKLIFQHGTDGDGIVAGKTEIPRWTWQHVVFTRDGESVRVYLNGKLEIETTSPAGFPANMDRLFLGGRSDNAANWEGRLDEIAIFNRPLSPEEVAQLAAQ
ncbi:LamG domain-containing protein [Maioricimonas sp. JC845]|uniref:LamG domain-containing protein n=1 Tax=Maioricimonas sp. JC845 TaxID=3232138 RepID=UPI0034579E6B